MNKNITITSEFCKAFSDQLAPFLLGLFLKCIDNETLPPTLTQGLITLIPKPRKDKLLIDNWRPICLLNNECQSGFMRHRHISKHVRLVLDLIDYSDLCLDESLILFQKAFDTIEHKCIFHALEKFGFGSYFNNAIKL